MEIASKGQLRLAYLRWAIVTVPAIVLLGFLSGTFFPGGSDNAWYVMLAKPATTPPDWAFPVAWTIIYILMGLALAIVINARGAPARKPAIALFAVQLVANLAWSPLFFGGHQVFGSLLLLIVIFVLVTVTAVLFARIRKAAGLMLVPYLLWVAFAGYVLYGIHQLNPNAEGLVPSSSSAQMQIR